MATMAEKQNIQREKWKEDNLGFAVVTDEMAASW